MKKYFAIMSALAMTFSAFAFVPIAGAVTIPYWNVTGTYQWLESGTNAHDMVITTQNPDGTFSGTGGFPAGSSPYTAAGQTPETITGQVTGNAITFTTLYAGPFNPGYSATVSGTIAADGSMSGTDPFEWHTTSGNAVALGSLSAEDFGVVNYDTGLGFLKGYTAGFGLTDATFAGATSVVVKLYSAGDVLMQTNTAIFPKFNTDITGTQFSSPFDVSGSFNYATDGYWTNVREVQYGQSVPAVKVVATVTLANGKVVTATNTNPTGDPTTIYPVNVSVTTNPATNVNSNDATLNGTNGPVDATGHSFWVSLAPFVTTSPTIPSGVYSTPDFGAIAANTAFSASLSSITTAGVPGNLPAITPNTTYYFAAWSLVGGIWYPGAILNFTTTNTTANPGTISGQTYNDLNKNEIKDSGEPGIPGFTIKLYNNPDWSGPTDIAPIMTAVTDANGNYSFGNLPDSTYSVEEVNLPAWHQDTSDYSPLAISNGVAITNIDFANTPKKAGDKEKENHGKSFHGFFGRFNGWMHGIGNKFGLLKHGVVNGGSSFGNKNGRNR